MTLIFADGFDQYTNTSDAVSEVAGSVERYTTWQLGRLGFSTAITRFGEGQSLYFTISGLPIFDKIYPSANVGFMSFSVYLNENYTAAPTYGARIRWREVTNNITLCTMYLRTNGNIEFNAGTFSDPVAVTASAVILPNQWTDLEIKTEFNTTSGVFEIKRAGEVILTYNGPTTVSDAGMFSNQFFCEGGRNTMFFDNWVTWNNKNEGDGFTDYKGNYRCQTFYPTSALGLTISTSTPSSDYVLVGDDAEIALRNSNTTTSYVAISSATSRVDMYFEGTVSAATSSIEFLQPYQFFRRDSTNDAQNSRIFVELSGVQTYSNTLSPGTVWQYGLFTKFDDEDGNPITNTKLQSVKIGLTRQI